MYTRKVKLTGQETTEHPVDPASNDNHRQHIGHIAFQHVSHHARVSHGILKGMYISLHSYKIDQIQIMLYFITLVSVKCVCDLEKTEKSYTQGQILIQILVIKFVPQQCLQVIIIISNSFILYLRSCSSLLNLEVSSFFIVEPMTAHRKRLPRDILPVLTQQTSANHHLTVIEKCR